MVRDGEVVDKAVGTKQLAIYATSAGGTHEEAIEPARQEQPVLTDAQVVRLAQLGHRIEAHFGCPQDIEWCLVDDDFQIVQSRPITTVFPIPARDDGENHVYLSVGHQQMMTDPMKPLGLAMWKLTALPPMHVAGGRVFVDVTKHLASPANRVGLLELAGRGDPPIRDVLQTVLDRGDFIPPPFAKRSRGERRRPSIGWNSLTPTELQVVELIGRGSTNAEAAEQLFISPATVKTHVAHIYRKLDIANRSTLTAAYLTHTSGDD